MKQSKAEIGKVLKAAKSLARRYRKLTGKPLGVTGEVAEFSAAQLLGLTLAPARQAGFDATRRKGGKIIRYQIKGRCIPSDAKRSQRIGTIRFKHKWDAVLLVLLDENMNTTAIHEASRRSVKKALLKPGSKARNERGSLGVTAFTRIGDQVWPKKKS